MAVAYFVVVAGLVVVVVNPNADIALAIDHHVFAVVKMVAMTTHSHLMDVD